MYPTSRESEMEHSASDDNIITQYYSLNIKITYNRPLNRDTLWVRSSTYINDSKSQANTRQQRFVTSFRISPAMSKPPPMKWQLLFLFSPLRRYQQYNSSWQLVWWVSFERTTETISVLSFERELKHHVPSTVTTATTILTHILKSVDKWLRERCSMEYDGAPTIVRAEVAHHQLACMKAKAGDFIASVLYLFATPSFYSTYFAIIIFALVVMPLIAGM